MDERAVDRLLGVIGAGRWSGEGRPALVITGGGEGLGEAHWRSQRIPVLTVGSGGRFRLPDDAALLAEAVLAVPGAIGRRAGGVLDTDEGEPLRILVAGWHGGAGTTRVARALAGAAGSVLVDATGFAPGAGGPAGMRAEGVRWADLDSAERAYGAELVDALPVIDGTRMLVADVRGGADCADPRLGPAVAALSDEGVVIDAGRWGGLAHRAHLGLADALVLVGHCDVEGACALASSLSSWAPRCATVLVHSGKANLLAEAAPGIPARTLRRVLRGRRGPRALVALVRAERDRAWARTWGEERR